MGVGNTVANDDTVITSIGIGSQLDGLGHIGRNHVYYNNRKSEDVVAPDGVLSLAHTRCQNCFRVLFLI